MGIRRSNGIHLPSFAFNGAAERQTLNVRHAPLPYLEATWDKPKKYWRGLPIPRRFNEPENRTYEDNSDLR